MLDGLLLTLFEYKMKLSKHLHLKSTNIKIKIHLRWITTDENANNKTKKSEREKIMSERAHWTRYDCANYTT